MRAPATPMVRRWRSSSCGDALALADFAGCTCPRRAASHAPEAPFWCLCRGCPNPGKPLELSHVRPRPASRARSRAGPVWTGLGHGSQGNRRRCRRCVHHSASPAGEASRFLEMGCESVHSQPDLWSNAASQQSQIRCSCGDARVTEPAPHVSEGPRRPPGRAFFQGVSANS
jgi:hypothetical protein